MNKEVKLFLSSTFDKKMHTRRDYFKNEISAHLNKIVGQTGKNLFVYDYEVGIPKGTPMETVLNTCFKKIDSSDYFIAIIDEEYGDTEIEKKLNGNAKILKRYESLIRQGIDNHLSVLELEIIKSTKKKKKRKFFFIRKDVQNRIPKLQALIQNIKTNPSSENVNDFSEDFEILTVLEKHFKEEINDELELYKKEQQNRNLIYANKMRYYVEGSATLNIISDYISNDCDKVLVLNGKSGSGKSTLLLNWIEQHRSDSEKNIVSCFVDIDGYTVSEAFRKFNNQISEIQTERFDNKQDEISILDSFIPFTHNLSKNNKKNIIILDGLDQINFANERKGEAAKYYWLNKTLPPNVKIIVSTTDKKIDKNKFQVHTINPYSLSEIVKNHLKKEGKELLYPDFKKLISFKNKNIDNIPVLARLICSEICMKANFEELPKFLTDYNEQLKKGAGIIDLYEGFLKRISERISILPEICCYLYCSQYGLDTNTLCELFKLRNENREEQIEHFSTLLYQDLRINVDGQMEFAHSYFKQAVERLYVRNNRDVSCYRNDIIKVLIKNKLTEQTLPECAYQINMLKSKDKMYELLSDIDNANELYNINQILFLKYLTLIEDKKNVLFENYEINQWNEYIPFLAEYYQNIADYVKAEQCHKVLMNEYESEFGKNHLETASSYINMAMVYRVQGNYNRALEYCSKAKTICEKVLGKKHPDTATIYNGMLLVYYHKGDYHRALEYAGKALNIREKVLSKEHLDTTTTYNNMAVVYDAQGNYNQALEYYSKALVIREKILGAEHPRTVTIYNNMAMVYRMQGNFNRALEKYEKVKTIDEEVFGKEHPDTATTYDNMAVVYWEQGDYKEALEYHEKALAIYEKVLGKGHSDTAAAYNNIALVYCELGNYDLALEYYGKALTVCEKALGKKHPDTAATYNNIALVYDELGNYDLALEWYLKSLLILIKVSGKKHPKTKFVRSNMANAYEKSSKPEPFEEWLERKMEQLY